MRDRLLHIVSLLIIALDRSKGIAWTRYGPAASAATRSQRIAKPEVDGPLELLLRNPLCVQEPIDQRKGRYSQEWVNARRLGRIYR
jgi:hypothetical protein